MLLSIFIINLYDGLKTFTHELNALKKEELAKRDGC